MASFYVYTIVFRDFIGDNNFTRISSLLTQLKYLEKSAKRNKRQRHLLLLQSSSNGEK